MQVATALWRFPRWRYDGAVLSVARLQSCMCRSSMRVATATRSERLRPRHIRAARIVPNHSPLGEHLRNPVAALATI